jgi:hypothetical protein
MLEEFFEVGFPYVSAYGAMIWERLKGEGVAEGVR